MTAGDLHFDVPAPWPTPVELTDLLDETVHTLTDHLVLSEHAPEAIALWVGHTYVIGSCYFSPRLVLTSPVMRCGKTTTLALVHNLASRPLSVSSASPAAIFRVMKAEQPTLLLDEAEGWLTKDELLRTIVNAGYSRASSIVIRVHEKTFDPVPFDSFGAWRSH